MQHGPRALAAVAALGLPLLTATLAFAAGKFDMTFPNELSIPLLNDVHSQSPKAVCQVAPSSETTGLLINRSVPPFDNPELRRAIGLTLDRKSFIDILGHGGGDVGGAMQPPPEGVWGCNPAVDKLVEQQSMEPDMAKRKQLAWPEEEMARPIIYHLKSATGWQPEVKGLTIMVNSQYNGWRMEDVWLDRQH